MVFQPPIVVLTGAGLVVPRNAPLSHRVRLKTGLGGEAYPGLKTFVGPEPNFLLFSYHAAAGCGLPASPEPSLHFLNADWR